MLDADGPRQHKNKHHIIPRSRVKGINIVLPVVNQEVYCLLFPNDMSPLEVLQSLNDKFWNNNYKIKILEGQGKSSRHKSKRLNIPQSRFIGQTVSVLVVDHNNYHCLFSNLAPPEIVDWLNEKYWNSQYRITIRERSGVAPK